jgi:fibronectin-binding autotransporter adhesin
MSSSSLPPRARFSPRSGFGFMAAIALTSTSLQAASLYWDPNGATGGTGGSGTWSAGGSNAYWAPNADGSGTHQVWTDTVNPVDSAVFGGTAGVVAVDGTVRAISMSLTTGGYEINGGVGGTGLIYLKPSAVTSTNNVFTWASGTGTTTVSSNITVDYTANNAVQSRYYFRNQTAGNLILSGNISYAGTFGGNTKFLSFSQEDANGSITVNGRLLDSVTTTGSSIQVGVDAAAKSTAKYYFNGDNSQISNGNSADLTKGVVYAGHNNALGKSTSTIRLGNNAAASDSISLLTNGEVTLANPILLTGDIAAIRTIGGGSAHQSSFNGTNHALKLTAIANGRTDFSGVINDSSATGSIEKNGAGIVRLTNASGNTYDGGTTISAGTLIVTNTSNSATGTAGVQVAGNATLGGTGRISGLVTASTANSIFSAGDMAITGVSSIGTLNLAGGLTAASGANFKFDLNGASSDLINFGTAAVTLSGTVTFDFANLGVVQEGTTYTLFTGTGGTWNNTGSTFVFNGPSGYQLDTTYGTNGYVWDASGHSLSVRFDAIPEPETSLLIGLGLSVVLFARRRHTRLS